MVCFSKKRDGLLGIEGPGDFEGVPWQLACAGVVLLVLFAATRMHHGSITTAKLGVVAFRLMARLTSEQLQCVHRSFVLQD